MYALLSDLIKFDGIIKKNCLLEMLARIIKVPC